ncbi:MAG TPA: SDR family oxidoreductase [Chloroflexota bacterium]
MVDLNGKVVIVAGASSGMGRATALAFAAAGSKVVAGARREDALKEMAAEAAGKDGEVAVLGVDATVKSDAESLVRFAVERFGRVDVLVNSVGTNTPNRLLPDLRDEDWQEMIDINLQSAYNLTRAILPQMRAQGGGLIVHISSCSGRFPDFSGIGYQAAKAGVIALAHGTMIEERGNGLRVSVIMPGLVDTPIMLKRKKMPSRETLDKALKPEDIAATCVFLASLPPHAYIPEVPILPNRQQVLGQVISAT